MDMVSNSIDSVPAQSLGTAHLPGTSFAKLIGSGSPFCHSQALISDGDD